MTGQKGQHCFPHYPRPIPTPTQSNPLAHPPSPLAHLSPAVLIHCEGETTQRLILLSMWRKPQSFVLVTSPTIDQAWGWLELGRWPCFKWLNNMQHVQLWGLIETALLRHPESSPACLCGSFYMTSIDSMCFKIKSKIQEKYMTRVEIYQIRGSFKWILKKSDINM